MAMANLPATTSQSSGLTPTDAQLEPIIELISAGQGPAEIARKLEPNDPVKRKLWRNRIRNWMITDPRVANGIAANARVNLLVGLGPATRALARRASTGRPDAIKLLFEASGFHNPRVQHEHSGEIEVKISMPRPKALDPDQEVTDAEVVEE